MTCLPSASYKSFTMQVAWLLVFCLVYASSADRRDPKDANPIVPSLVYGIEDLLVAIPVHSKAAAVIESTRLWRMGVRTHFVVDVDLDLEQLRVQGQQFNETFFSFPDLPGVPNTMRQVLTPLSAYHTHIEGPRFKWMLLGDADTIFNIPAILRMLNDCGLPSDEPHVLTDYLIERVVCPTGPTDCMLKGLPRVDSRCLPCPGQAPTCPCRLPETCYKPALNPKLCPTRVTAYGGAGIIFSVGMLRELVGDANSFYGSAFQHVAVQHPYSDTALSETLRDKGYGFTMIPRLNTSTKPTRRFGTYGSFNDQRPPQQQVQDFAAVLKDRPHVLEYTLSFHMRGPGRRFNFVVDVLPYYSMIARVFGMSTQKLESADID